MCLLLFCSGKRFVSAPLPAGPVWPGRQAEVLCELPHGWKDQNARPPGGVASGSGNSALL